MERKYYLITNYKCDKEVVNLTDVEWITESVRQHGDYDEEQFLKIFNLGNINSEYQSLRIL